MTRSFSLAGLLRVRRTQEKAAAGRLSRAQLEAGQSAARERHLRTALGGAPTDVTDTRSLAALAAARAAGRSALADLSTLAAAHRAERDEAAHEHHRARREAKALGILEADHRRRRLEDEQHAEQLALDEIATSRATGGDA